MAVPFIYHTSVRRIERQNIHTTGVMKFNSNKTEQNNSIKQASANWDSIREERQCKHRAGTCGASLYSRVSSARGTWTWNNSVTKNLNVEIFVTLEVLTAFKMTTLFFRVVTPCGLVGRYQRHFNTEDENSMYLRIVGYQSTKWHGVTA
jgi:hypothetical protein